MGDNLPPRKKFKKNIENCLMFYINDENININNCTFRHHSNSAFVDIAKDKGRKSPFDENRYYIKKI